MPFLTLKIGQKIYNIPFEKAEVYENPAVVSPELFIEFDDLPEKTDMTGTEQFTEGESIFFTVYVRYCAQILKFHHKLPVDSIFNETERFDSAGPEVRRSEFTSEKIPLARYEWIPLTEGEIKLPEFSIDGIAFNGDRKRIFLPGKSVKIIKKSVPDESSVFEISDAVSFEGIDSLKSEKSENKIEFTQSTKKEKCSLLAEIRSKERRTLPFGKKHSQLVQWRKDIEKGLLLEETDGEQSFVLVKIMIAAFFIFTVLFILCICLKKFHTAVFFVFFMILSGAFTVIYSTEFFKSYGIYAGGRLRVIPDLNSSFGQSVQTGFKVRIVEKSSDWVYIEAPDCTGWVKEEDVYEFR